MPKTNYHQETFWESKYKVTCCEHYEWLHIPNEIINLIKQQLGSNKNLNILELGCGTSILNERIYSLGYQKITSIDFSKEVIKSRLKKQQREGKYHINYVNGNLICLKDKDQCYDVIIDKCTIDCLFCDENLIKSVLKGMKECYRLLKKRGKLIIISQGKPKLRKFLFRNKFAPFQLNYFPIRIKPQQQNSLSVISENQNYFYVCRKNIGQNTNISEQNAEQQDNQQFDNEDNDSSDRESSKKDEEQNNDEIQNGQQQMQDQQNVDKKETDKQEKSDEEGQQYPEDDPESNKQKQQNSQADEKDQQFIITKNQKELKKNTNKKLQKQPQEENDGQFILQ